MSQVGTFVILKLDSKILVGQSDCSYNNAITMIETSNKLSGNDSEFVAGRSNKTISVSGIAGMSAEETKMGFEELEAAAEARVAIAFSIMEYTDQTVATPATDTIIRSGMCLISKASLTAPDNAKNTFSCDLQVTGGTNTTDTDFNAFTIAGQTSSVVNKTAHTVAVLMPTGTNPDFLVPSWKLNGAGTVTVSAAIKTSGNDIIDFSTPVTMTVTAADGVTTQAWVVTVTIAA